MIGGLYVFQTKMEKEVRLCKETHTLN